MFGPKSQPEQQIGRENFLRDNPVNLIQDGSTVTIKAPQKQHTRSWFSFGRIKASKVPLLCRASLTLNSRLREEAVGVSELNGKVKAHTSGGDYISRACMARWTATPRAGGIEMENLRRDAQDSHKRRGTKSRAVPGRWMGIPRRIC